MSTPTMFCRIAMLCFAVLGLSTTASAQLLWDNGSWDGSSNLSSVRQTGGPVTSTTADDAIFGTSVRITGFSWDSIFAPRDSNPVGTDLVILTDSLGTVFNFSDLAYSRELLGTDRGFPVYRVTVSGLDISLAQGRYYFGGRMVTTTADAYSELQSNVTHGITESYFQSDYFGYHEWSPASQVVGHPTELAFRVYGEPVPEPSAFASFSLAALGFVAFRRSKVVSATSKSFGIDPAARILLTEAASVEVATKRIAVGTAEVKLTAGLANRRYLWIKPLAAGGERFIYIGESGFSSDTTQAVIVWEKYEMGMPVTPDVQVYAVKDDLSGDLDVRILEVGED